MQYSPEHADLRNPYYCEWLAFLRAAENWHADRIAAHQLAEVRRMVRHAWDHTVAYRRLYENAGLGPDSIRSLDDVMRLPFVTKDMMRDNIDDFRVSDISQATYVTTGGSTGIPFGFYRDDIAFARELGSKAFQYYRVGWRERDAQFVLRGLPIERGDHMQFVAKFNELRCSSYHMTPDVLETYRQRAWDYKPDWLRCYPSSGHLLADFLKTSTREFPPLKGILCASENLYDFQKQLFQDVFHCRVFSHYGHYEMAVLAGFCEYEDTYHVLPHYGLAELIDARGKPVSEPGQMGEIVGTSFLMSVTPFIRYRTRDFAVLKGFGCAACGRPYQIWERIEGRLQEFIVTASGRLISMTAINMHDDTFDHVAQFQFYQQQAGEVVFRYIPKPTINAGVLTDIHSRLRRKLGEGVQLVMEGVEQIAPTARGKHRFLIQELRLGIGDDQ